MEFSHNLTEEEQDIIQSASENVGYYLETGKDSGSLCQDNMKLRTIIDRLLNEIDNLEEKNDQLYNKCDRLECKCDSLEDKFYDD